MSIYESPNHLFKKTEVSKVVVKIDINRVVIRSTFDRKLFTMYLLSTEGGQVQIEAACNYPICCFRSTSHSSWDPNRWILFMHSFIQFVQSKFINYVFATSPGAGFEGPLKWRERL